MGSTRSFDPRRLQSMPFALVQNDGGNDETRQKYNVEVMMSYRNVVRKYLRKIGF